MPHLCASWLAALARWSTTTRTAWFPTHNSPHSPIPATAATPPSRSYTGGRSIPARARAAFESSPFVRRVWPERVIGATLPYFEHQRTINAVFWDSGRPVRDIETLHRLLTETPLRTLPLWVMGGDQATESIPRGGTTTAAAASCTCVA